MIQVDKQIKPGQTLPELYGLEKGEPIIPHDIIESFLLPDSNTMRSYHTEPNQGGRLGQLHPLSVREHSNVSRWDVANLDWVSSVIELPVLQRIGEHLQPKKTLHIGVYHGYTIAALLNAVPASQIEGVYLVDSDPVRYPMAPKNDQRESMAHAHDNIRAVGIPADKIHTFNSALDDVTALQALAKVVPFDVIEIDTHPKQITVMADLMSVLRLVSLAGAIFVHNADNEEVQMGLSQFLSSKMAGAIRDVQYIPTNRGLVLIRVKPARVSNPNVDGTIPPIPED